MKTHDQNSSKSTSVDIDVATLVSICWRRKWLIGICVLVFGGIAVGTALVMKPIYRATTVLAPSTSGGGDVVRNALAQVGGLAALAGFDLSGGNSATEEALAVLRSREFTEAFIRDNNLMPSIFYKRWDAERGAWKGNSNSAPTLAEAYKEFDERIRRISRDNKTGLVSLHIEWHDREQAAAWANELVARLNAEMRKRAIERTNASIRFLQQELAATSIVETRGAISRLIESQINQRMYANVTEEYAFRVVDRALAPDIKDKIRPKPVVMTAIGLLLGMLTGVAIVVATEGAGGQKTQ